MVNGVVFLKKTFLFLFFNTLVVLPVFAQEQSSGREDLWVCPVFESNWFSIKNIAIGGGAALGYGERVTFGLKVFYCDDINGVRTLELNFLLRLYLFRGSSNSGLFFQFNGGPVIFAQDKDSLSVPSEIGTISTGISLGWRFLFGSHFFLEPAVRGGYPYAVGAGLSAGVRF
jgi:hypothetical protein